MTCAIVMIITVLCSRPVLGLDDLITDFPSLLPWAESMKDEEFKNNIELRLVKKDWLPEGVTFPKDSGVIPQYQGTVVEAFSLFKNEALYQFHAQPLTHASVLLTSMFGYNPNLESIFVIHTISGDAENYFVKNVIYALAMRNIVRNYNVFAFNMPQLQISMEQTVVRTVYGMDANYIGIGGAIGSFFQEAIQANLITADKIHLITFCYSSQLAGYIGRYITSHNNGQKIKSILGLDPYSLGLSSLRHQVVSASDAQVVHLYHTNSAAFGTVYRRGTADFVFNSGLMQPGCLTSTNYMCSHRRVVLLLWYIILYPDKFVARRCPNLPLYLACWCYKNPTATLTYPLDESVRGQYFLDTSSRRPYGYGPSGANCHDKHIEEKIHIFIDDVDFALSRVF